MSSNDALQKVKRIYTPTVPGIPVRWTRWRPACCRLPRGSDEVFPVSAGLRQTLSVIARLGQRTDTSDADGQIVESVR